jgi:alkanesulfonate monooxygenase SsuD/methylene tetrahydromethanopterin reductase-like flavin-dependent oxidoreductase (luciferase family)
VPPVEEALEAAKDPRAKHWLASIRRRSVVGSPKTVRVALEQHAVNYEVEEIMAVTICYDFAARKRSYALLAEEFGLIGA